MYYLGIDLGGTNIAVGVVDESYQIIARAKQIGTYDISTQDAPDCCTLFMPRRPETHAKMDKVHEAWDMFDHDAMIDQLVRDVEHIDFPRQP